MFVDLERSDSLPCFCMTNPHNNFVDFFFFFFFVYFSILVRLLCVFLLFFVSNSDINISLLYFCFIKKRYAVNYFIPRVRLLFFSISSSRQYVADVYSSIWQVISNVNCSSAVPRDATNGVMMLIRSQRWATVVGNTWPYNSFFKKLHVV